jgi:hypothetical protein
MSLNPIKLTFINRTKAQCSHTLQAKMDNGTSPWENSMAAS